MELACLLHQYLPALKANYAHRLLPGHYRAIGAMMRCRTPDAGQLRLHCTAWHPNATCARVRAHTVVAPNARTMKRACGSTDNAQSCSRSSTLW